MISSPLHGAQHQGGQHGRLCIGNRTADEATVRLAGREGSTTVRRHRGDEVGAGGIEYIAGVLECDPKTIRQGQAELEGTNELDTGRGRKKGVDANG
jgi:hypothetical protein